MSKPCLGAPSPTAPSFEMPASACDCHIHVLGPYAEYPLAEERAYTAPEAPLRLLPWPAFPDDAVRVPPQAPGSTPDQLGLASGYSHRVFQNISGPGCGRVWVEGYGGPSSGLTNSLEIRALQGGRWGRCMGAHVLWGPWPRAIALTSRDADS